MLKRIRLRKFFVLAIAMLFVPAVFVHGLSLAFDQGGVNGVVGRALEGTWFLWDVLHRAVTTCAEARWLGSNTVLRYAYMWPYDMLDQVYGARMAERDFSSGRRQFIGTALSGQVLVGIESLDYRLLHYGPRGCRVTWDGSMSLGGYIAFAKPSAEEVAKIPTDVPAGLYEVRCNPEQGAPERLIVGLEVHFCYILPRYKGYNERMLALISASGLTRADV